MSYIKLSDYDINIYDDIQAGNFKNFKQIAFEHNL